MGFSNITRWNDSEQPSNGMYGFEHDNKDICFQFMDGRHGQSFPFIGRKCMPDMEENVCQIVSELNHPDIFHESFNMDSLSRLVRFFIPIICILNESFIHLDNILRGYIYFLLFISLIFYLTMFDFILIGENFLQPGYLLFNAANFYVS